MAPVNATERNKAFRNFLIFFIITIAIIVATVFLSTEVNSMEIKQLKAEKDSVAMEKEFTVNFEDTINSTLQLLELLNDKEANVDLVGDKIKEKLRDMDEMIQKKSMAGKGLYELVTANLNQLYIAKKELREVTNKDDTQTDLKEKIQELKSELQSTQLDLKLCQFKSAQKD